MSSETVDWLIVCTITRGGKANEAHVDSNSTLPCRNLFLFFIFCLDGNVPFPNSFTDGDILDLACDVPAFSGAYPSYLRQVYPAVSLFLLHPLRIADAVTDNLALESRKVCSFRKKIPVRRFKVFHALLEYLAVTRFQPLEFTSLFR